MFNLIYVNEELIYWLSLLIVNTAVCLYLFGLKNKTPAAWSLLGLFLSLEGLYLSTTLMTGTSSLLFIHSVQRKIQLSFLLLGMPFLLRFVYVFRNPAPGLEREWRRVKRISIGLALVGLGFSGYALLRPAQPENHSFLYQLIAITAGILWAMLVILRRARQLQRGGDFRSAQALNAFLAPFSLIVGLAVVEMLYTGGLISAYAESLVMSFGFLGFYFLFIQAYLNHTWQATTILVKLVGVTLITVLWMFGNLGNVLAPYFKQDYRNPEILSASTALQFTPNSQQSYTIQKETFSWQTELGTALVFENQLNGGLAYSLSGQMLELPFGFEFYGRPQTKIQIMPIPVVIFSPTFTPYRQEIGLYYPTIYAAGANLSLLKLEPQQVFYKADPTQALVTWQNIRFAQDGVLLPGQFSVQLTLFADGSFRLAYAEMPPAQIMYNNNWGTSLDVIGIYPGNLARRAEINWLRDLPYTGSGLRPITQDYFAVFQRYMHDHLLPVAGMLLAVSLFILFGFPFFFRQNLVQPLQALVDGVSAVNTGNLTISIPPLYNDEIGFLTHSFNGMVTSIRQNEERLESQVQERTAALSQVNARLEMEIQERAQAEMQLRQLWLAVEQSPTSILISDTSGAIQYVNPQFSALTGYSPQEAIGQNPRILQSGQMPPELYQEMWQKLTHGEIWQGELLNKKKNGELYWEQAVMAPVKDNQGRVTHYIAIKENITQRKELERQRTDIIQTMVHDLRNPLSSIGLGLAMLRSMLGDPGLPAEADETLTISQKSTERMLLLVNAILDTSRLESGQMPLNRRPTHLAELLGETLSAQSPLLTEKALQLAQTLPADLPLLDVDREIIQRVLQNLIGNAIKFTPAGGSIHIRAQAAAGQPHLQVTVSDSGPGVDAQIRDRLFEKFVTGKIQERGSGLGLAYCKLAIQAHGGRIWLDANTSQGTSISFTLPLVTTPPAPPAPA